MIFNFKIIFQRFFQCLIFKSESVLIYLRRNCNNKIKTITRQLLNTMKVKEVKFYYENLLLRLE